MKKYIKPAIIILALSLAAELFLFNFRAIESASFTPAREVIENGDGTFSYADGSGAAPDGLGTPGTYTIVYPEGVTFGPDGIVDFTGEYEPQVTVNGSDILAQNIFIDVDKTPEDIAAKKGKGGQEKINVLMHACDEGNSYPYDLPQITIYCDEPGTNYIRLNLSGKMKQLNITFPNLGTHRLVINSIKLNVRRPFEFKPLRFISVVLLLTLVYAFRPASAVYRGRYSLKNNRHLAAVFLLIILELTLIVNVSTTGNRLVNKEYVHHRQYYKLAVALTEGHFYLEDVPSPELVAMENPYDRHARQEEHVSYIWDTAYYEGKYYCYFGILPVLTYYLPYYLLTGNEFPEYIGIIVNLTVTALMLILLIDELIDRFFPDTSLGELVLLDLALFSSCALLVGAQTSTFYILPISMGLMLMVSGLYCWIAARHKFSTVLTVTGAAFMALTAACRPQFALASFLVFPLLGGSAMAGFRDKDDPARRTKAIWTVVMAVVPYIIVAALLMYYNAARFGSPFDFGANYNLTTNDMTHRGFHLDRLPFGYFMYLLQPPVFTGMRPYLSYVPVFTYYQGLTVFESMCGGLFWFCPMILGAAGLFSAKVRRALREKKLLLFSVAALVLGFFITGLDIEMAGILQRYWMDFGVLFALSGVVCLLARGEVIRKDASCCTQADGGEVASGEPYRIISHVRFLFVSALVMLFLWGLWLYRFI